MKLERNKKMLINEVNMSIRKECKIVWVLKKKWIKRNIIRIEKDLGLILGGKIKKVRNIASNPPLGGNKIRKKEKKRRKELSKIPAYRGKNKIKKKIWNEKIISRTNILLSKLKKKKWINNENKDSILSWIYMGIEEEMRYRQRNNSKYRGIEISMEGRLGKKKLGRKRKFKAWAGGVGSGVVRQPGQYSKSQIHTKLGCIGLKVWIK